MATITLEILKSRRDSSDQEPNSIFHLINPSRSSWSSLIPAIQEMHPARAVTLNEWLNELDSIQNPSDKDILEKPALKLLDFYRGLANNSEVLSVPLRVSNSQKASQTMACLQPVSHAQMLNWLQQWSF